MNKKFVTKTILAIAIGLFGIGGPVSADTSKLVGQLVDLLGVTQPQAEGGAGAIFKAANRQYFLSAFSQWRTTPESP
jgi:hypothetical protein